MTMRLFFVRDGELDTSGRMQVVDVLPTVYDRVGMEAPPDVDGRSFLT